MARTVRSIVPLRRKPADHMDFGRVHGTFQYEFNRKASPAARAEQVALWNRYIPLTPEQAAKILTRDLPKDTAVTFKLEKDGSGEFNIYALNKFDDEASFDLTDKSLDAGTIRVQDAYMGQGIGRKLIRNQVEFFHACGVRTFDISAQFENGGYTWARVGFLPDDVRDDNLKEDVAEPARRTIDMLAPLLEPAEKKKLRRYLQFKKKEDLWRVADSDIDLGPRLKDVFSRAAAKKGDKKQAQYAREYLELLKTHFTYDLFDYMESQAKKGKPVNVGRLLLTGTSWTGAIDMNNPKQMKRLGNYTGGWKHIKIG